MGAIAVIAVLAFALWPEPHTAGRVTSCERTTPHVVIVGASFTAGVGPGNPGDSWAELLARRQHWDAVVDGVPGAGYVRAGASHLGPMSAELDRAGLRAFGPTLVIVQAGHDDIGVPVAVEERQVTQAIAMIRAQVPKARIALITVFPRRSPTPAAYRTDDAIITAALAADPDAIIMNPLDPGWRFARVRDGLHPTVAGSRWLATKVAGVLRTDHVPTAPLTCDPDSRSRQAHSA
jgi:acyl-CoA thioesterase I